MNLEKEPIYFQELWDARGQNPLVVYFKPWRRGKFLLFLFIAFFLIAGGQLAYTINNRSNLDADFIFLVLVPLILIPLAFFSFAKERREEQLEEFYLTLLSREEVVFGSLYWGFVCGILLAVIYSAALVISLSVDLTLLGGIVVGLYAFPLFLIFLLKITRLYLFSQKHRWRIILLAPFTMIFDMIVILGGMGLMLLPDVERNPLSVVPAILFGLVVAFSLVLWNLSIATHWAVELYYKEIDKPSYSKIFLYGLLNVFKRRKKKPVLIMNQ